MSDMSDTEDSFIVTPAYLFEQMRNFGRSIRSGHYDGLKGWQGIKTILTSKTVITTVDKECGNECKLVWTENCDWKDFYRTMVTELQLTPENDDADIKEKHHFFLQLGRIPSQETLTLCHFLQIGYNLGQFVAVRSEENGYTRKQLSFFDNNLLCFSGTYVPEWFLNIDLPSSLWDDLKKIISGYNACRRT